MRKCKTKDCKRKIESPYVYCSIECACYDGAMSVKMEKKNLQKDRPMTEQIPILLVVLGLAEVLTIGNRIIGIVIVLCGAVLSFFDDGESPEQF